MRQRAWPGLLLCLLAAMFSLGAREAAANQRVQALLIGVTTYDLPAIRPLQGPNNDVILLWRELTRRGAKPDDITVLADGLPKRDDAPVAAASPTHDAIVREMRRLASRAGRGDLVVVQFSGHGTTQPVADPAAQIEPEPDGRDQVLLPRDAGRYDTALKSISNAVIDDDFARMLDAIRAKGATVWVIVDACHAGTVTRTAAVTRSVRSVDLGVPPGPGASLPPDASPRVAFMPQLERRDAGALIGFYAVDSRTEAIERPMPGFAPGLAGRENDERVGVFTASLISALQQGGARTYRELAQAALRQLQMAKAGASSPLPVFDGALDLPLIPGAAAPKPTFKAISNGQEWQIDAGALHGFEAGAVVTLLDKPTADAKPLGRANIAGATAATSMAKDAPAPAEAIAWATLETPAIVLAHRIARPANDDARIATLLGEALQGSSNDGFRPELVAAEAEADLRLALQDGRLWVVADGQTLVTELDRPDTSVGIRLDAPTAASELRDALWTLMRAANLVRIASQERATNEGGEGLDVKVETSRANVSGKDNCPLPDPKEELVSMQDGMVAGVSHCSALSVSLQNKAAHPIDVGVFYLDARGGLALFDERMAANGCTTPLPADMNRAQVLPVRRFSLWNDGKPASAGLQRLIVIGLPRVGSAAPSLCHLRQGSLEAAQRSASRSAGRGSKLQSLLAEAGMANGKARSARPAFVDDTESAQKASMRQFIFDLQPRAAQP